MLVRMLRRRLVPGFGRLAGMWLLCATLAFFVVLPLSEKSQAASRMLPLLLWYGTLGIGFLLVAVSVPEESETSVSGVRRLFFALLTLGIVPVCLLAAEPILRLQNAGLPVESAGSDGKSAVISATLFAMLTTLNFAFWFGGTGMLRFLSFCLIGTLPFIGLRLITHDWRGDLAIGRQDAEFITFVMLFPTQGFLIFSMLAGVKPYRRRKREGRETGTQSKKT